MNSKSPLVDVQHDDVVAMGNEVVQALVAVRDAFMRLDVGPLAHASRLVRRVQEQEHDLVQRMVKAAAAPGGSGDAGEDAICVPLHLQRIADNIELLDVATRRVIAEAIPLTDRGRNEAARLFGLLVEMLEALRDGMRTGNRTLLRYVEDAGRQCAALANEFALFHEQRLIEGVCQPKASSVYLAMLDHFRGMEWHARQVAEKLGSGRDSA